MLVKGDEGWDGLFIPEDDTEPDLHKEFENSFGLFIPDLAYKGSVEYSDHRQDDVAVYSCASNLIYNIKTDLDRELNEPRFQPLPTVGVRLISIMDDAMIHAGQAAYVRGLRQGKGWQKY